MADEAPGLAASLYRIDGDRMRFARVGRRAGRAGGAGCLLILIAVVAGVGVWVNTESAGLAAAAFAVPGLLGICAVALERYEAWLDRSAKEVAERWTFLGWTTERRRPFGSIDAIDLEAESDGEFEVEIGLTNGIEVYDGRSYETARALADAIAEFSGLPVRDQHRRTGPGFDAPGS